MASDAPSSGTDGVPPAPGQAPPGQAPPVTAPGVSEPVPSVEPSTGELLKGLADDASTLVRQEVLLARQEMTEGLASRARAGSVLVVGGVLGLYGLGFLLASAAAAISGPAWLGPLIIGGGLVLVAGMLALLGSRRLSRSKVAPERARAQLRETATELREEIRWVRPRRRPPERSS